MMGMCLVISRKNLMIIGAIGLLLVVSAILFMNHTRPAVQEIGPRGYLALVIDDFGNHGEGTEAMVNLGVPLTAAVMPFLPFSRADADLAHQAGLEVIMHIPMEPIRGKPSWLGPGAITCGLSGQEIKTRLLDGLTQLKWAVGMNNHMGSRAMQDTKVVKAVMELARQENLFFLDSRTTAAKVAMETADALSYPYLARDEFLDGCKVLSHIKKQLRKLGELALRKGYAIGIGHVGAEGGTVTAQAIQEMYPEFIKQGICLVYVSQIKEVAAYSKN
jgi:polysaccharide deacetylase 2 family uncharacterized protein YibQ